jgi:2-isopropylmalate synthase
MSDKRTIKIFDTTLRDGEQSPGASMNLAEKAGDRPGAGGSGVDIIEAGFPDRFAGRFRGGAGDRHVPRASTVCGLARCNDADIDRAWEALKHAEHPRIHVFLATSAIHREFKLKMTGRRSWSGPSGVKRAVGYCDDVEFSPEDAADRTRLPLRGRRAGDRSGSHDDQHPRYGRLCHAALRWAIRSPCCETEFPTSTGR